MDLTRRHYLAGAAAAVGGYAIAGGSGLVGGGYATDPGPRFDSYAPVQPGGTAITIDGDSYGTLAAGIESNGVPFGLTNRHVVDDNYPDSTASDVTGTEVFDMLDRKLGTVSDVSTDPDNNPRDWALIELGDHWTPDMLGMYGYGESSVSVGERVVIVGPTTGLIGAEVTDIVTDRNGLGVQFAETIEYDVAGGRSTAGNSGAFVLSQNSGSYDVVGMHTFSTDTRSYALSLAELRKGVDIQLASPGQDPDISDRGPWVEGAVIGGNVLVANVGGATADREIRLLDGDTLIDSKTVTLDAQTQATLSMDTASASTLDTGDVERAY